MHGTDNRVLAYAALASLAFHAFLILGWPRVQQRLREPPRPPILSRLVEVEEPKPVPVAAPEPVAQAKPRVERRSTESKRPVLIEPATPVAPAIPEPPAAVTPAPRAVVEAKVVPPPSPPPAPVDNSATTIAQYRMQVLIEAGRLRSQYPDLLQDGGQPGRVVVALDFTAEGNARPKLKKSSGYAPLDERAVDLFRRAARGTPVPDTLRGRSFSFEVTAVSELKD